MPPADIMVDIPKLFVLNSVLVKIKSESSLFLMRETGGIIIGYRTRRLDIVVTHVSGPGPNATHSLYTFDIDHEYAQYALDHIFAETEGGLSFLGDWHTHPLMSTSLSGRDKMTLKDIASNENFICEKPLAIIFRPEYAMGSFVISESVSFYEYDNEEYLELEPIFIDDIDGYALPEFQF
jgi:integrative and conjugative element protein (TIGR02256 family)